MKFQVFNFETDLCIERELVYSIVTIHCCLQIILLKSKAEMNNILSLYTNCTNVYSSSSQIFLFAELERSITPFTMKRTVTNSRFYRMLILVKRNFVDAGLVDPCVFPVCTAYKVVHYSEYQNFSSVSPPHFNFL